MKRQIIGTIILFGGLLAWLTFDYLDHQQSFEDKSTLLVTVKDLSCRGSGGSKIEVDNNGRNQFLEVTGSVCRSLDIGQEIIVLRSLQTSKLYWNKEPSGRIFWLYPVVLLMISYIIFRGRKDSNN